MVELLLAAVFAASSAQHSGIPLPPMEKRVQAASGNSQEALELFERYMSENDPENSAFWLRVAAEQGDCHAVVEYGRMVGAGMQRKDEQKFWVQRAKDLSCDLSRVSYRPKSREEE